MKYYLILDPLKMGFVDGVFRSDSWLSILSLHMSTSILEYNEDISIGSAACTFWIGTESDIFGGFLKTADDFLENDNAIFFATVLSRLQHIILTNRFPVTKILYFFKIILF